jgi:hypothetical protein
MKQNIQSLFIWLFKLGVMGGLLLCFLFIFQNYKSFSIITPWHNKEELEKESSTETTQENNLQITPLTSITTSIAISLDFDATYLESLSNTLRNLSDSEASLYSVNCIVPTSKISKNCSSQQLWQKKDESSFYTKNLSKITNQSQTNSNSTQSLQANSAFANQSSCNITFIPVRITSSKSIIKDLIPIQVCNIDSVTDAEKGQINKLSKYFPTIAITHNQISSSTIDELEKLSVDIVVSSEKNVENLKPTTLSIFDVKSTENTISGARIEISFSKNSEFEKWKNESVSCRENSESCKLIYQKSMIKKPDFRITSSPIKSKVQ